MRAFWQEVAQGKNGIAVAAEDKDWQALLATDDKTLRAVILRVLDKELDRSPSQRWADATTDRGRESGPATGGLEFASLIKRHMVSKMTRVGAPNGILGFLQQAGLFDRLSLDSLEHIRGRLLKLEACLALCNFHASSTDRNGLALLESAMENVIFARLRADGFQDESEVRNQLKLSGLTAIDLFYSKITSIEELPAAIVEKLRDNRSVHTHDLIRFANDATATVLDLGDGALCEPLGEHRLRAATWLDSSIVQDAVREQLRMTWDDLDQRGDNSLLPCAGRLLYVLLVGAELLSGSESSVDAAEELKPLCSRVESQARHEGLGAAFDLLKALAERFVVERALLTVGNVHLAQTGRSDLLKAYVARGVSATLSCVETGAEVEMINFVGAPLHDNGESKWVLERFPDPSCTRWTVTNKVTGQILGLSGDGQWGLSPRRAQPSEQELIQLIDAEAVSDGAAPPVSGGQRQCILGYDGVSYLAVGELGAIDTDAVHHIGKWLHLPDYIFSSLLSKGDTYRILDLVENGVADASLERFLARQEPSDAVQREQVFNLRWLSAMRLKRFADAATVLSANDAAQRNGASTLNEALAVLCRRCSREE